MRRACGVLVGALVLVGSLAGGALADPQDVANDVANEVMSPFCPGVTLHDCASREASETREDMVRWAEAGMSKRQIIDRLESEFGTSIHASPPAEGAGLLAWILPALAVLSGTALAVVLMRRWNARGGDHSGDPAAASLSHDDRHRLELELKRLREQE